MLYPNATYMKKAVLLLTFIALTMVSCSADEEQGQTTNSGSAQNPTQNPTTEYSYDADELAMVRLINDNRNEIGLPSLLLQDYVSLVSQGHNDYMILNEVVNHDLFGQRVDDLTETLGASSFAENVAFNYQAASGAFDAWMNSDGHRAAIEGNFTHFGISVSSDAQGKKYYTAIFVTIVDP